MPLQQKINGLVTENKYYPTCFAKLCFVYILLPLPFTTTPNNFSLNLTTPKRMKRILIACTLSMLVVFPSFANVFRVNSSLSTDASQRLFKTLSEANSSSSVATGDTLMVEGSTVVYDNLTLTKGLVLIGPGYFLSQNANNQADGLGATVQQIEISPSASGAVLMGLTFSSSNTGYIPIIETNQVVVMRCYLPHPVEINASVHDIMIVDNYFAGTAMSLSNTAWSFTGVVLTNNYINGQLSIGSSNDVQRVFSAVENNIFASGSVSLTTNSFRNNILTTPSTVTLTCPYIENNLMSGSQLPATNGNQTYTASSLFVGTSGNSTDGQYQLLSNSPYKTAGANGAEPGIFGGSRPYILSGVPPIPVIYEIISDNFASKQKGLSVTIKVKSNQ